MRNLPKSAEKNPGGNCLKNKIGTYSIEILTSNFDYYVLEGATKHLKLPKIILNCHKWLELAEKNHQLITSKSTFLYNLCNRPKVTSENCRLPDIAKKCVRNGRTAKTYL